MDVNEHTGSHIKYDVFISHASEDKEAVVLPLYEILRGLGLRVWVDKFELKLGDSLNRKINEGLKQSRFGVVVLSKSFLKKEWPQKELDGLVAKEDGKDKVILPVWHDVTRDEVAEASLILADRMAVLTEHGIPYVAGQIFQAVNMTARAEDLTVGLPSSRKEGPAGAGESEPADEPLSLDERAAMRAYLQRSEVRLSTMHRIAGVFLNGAGLLLLFPVFFRESIQQTINFLYDFLLAQIHAISAHTNTLIAISNVVMCILLLVPFIASLLIPLYALVLLLKDIVHFYFTGHNPGFSDRLFNPRFALSGVAFSTDESPRLKKTILTHEYSLDLIHFILPFDEEQASYFDDVKEHTKGMIIPETRTMEYLDNMGVFLYPNAKPNLQDFHRFNTALGLAGVLDRQLSEEVAKLEVSLVRHALSLRRLVLRYLKALLMFIWTSLVSFLMISLLVKFPYLFTMALIYFIWGVLTPKVVKLPIKWILELSNRNAQSKVDRDAQLMQFEAKVTKLSRIIAVISLAVCVGAIAAFFFGRMT